MATNKQTADNFQTVIVPAIITATSNKVSSEFNQETPTKTIYFHVPDHKKVEQLEKFGMTQYTPDTETEPDAKPYFIAKATKIVKLYTHEDRSTFVEKPFTVGIFDEDTGLPIPNPNPNVYADEIVHLAIVKVKGGKGKNDFYRVNAILLPTLDTLKEVEAVNPFAELFGED